VFDTESTSMLCYGMLLKRLSVLFDTPDIRVLMTRYVIGESVLQRCTSVKDLGVIFANKLSFAEHYSNLKAAASKSLGFIIRCSRDLKFYVSFMRSKLEFSCVTWSPGYNIDRVNLEKTQGRFLKCLHLSTQFLF
jgi:hypothetical protein